jgi:hypothetical protein
MYDVNGVIREAAVLASHDLNGQSARSLSRLARGGRQRAR